MKTINAGDTVTGIDWDAVSKAQKDGYNHVSVSHNNSFHDSYHTFFIKKKKNGKVRNLRNWIKVSFDNAVIKDCGYFKASKYCDGF